VIRRPPRCLPAVLPAVLGLLPPGLGAMDLTVNSADLKDVLRAATADTDLNLVFEPGLDTRVQGLTLKGVALAELLDQVLPRLGLVCAREGRNLYVRKRGPELRFYPVEQPAMARSGSKTYQVNASGQVIQVSGAAGSGGSAYASSVQMEQQSDPWADLESGLQLLVFGRSVERQAGPAQAPGSRGFAQDGRRLLIQPHSGLVGVEADPATHERVAAYLDQLRRRTGRQVLLEARIVEVALTDDSQIGVDWAQVLAGGAEGLSFFRSGAGLDPREGLRLVASSGEVRATLSALARDHRLKVLSAPRLTALNNQKAILRVVKEEAYALASSQITPGTAAGGAVATAQVTPLIVPVGIVLDIQPQIGDDGAITLVVNPSISEVVEEKTFSAGAGGGRELASSTLPVVDRRDLDTVVRVRSGETLVLAGIIKTRDSARRQGVPWLRKVPFLGRLFSLERKARARVELAVFITPTLLEDTAQAAAERQRAEAGLARAEAEPEAGP